MCNDNCLDHGGVYHKGPFSNPCPACTKEELAALQTENAELKKNSQDERDTAYMEGGAHAKHLYEERTLKAEARVKELEAVVRLVQQWSDDRNHSGVPPESQTGQMLSAVRTALDRTEGCE